MTDKGRLFITTFAAAVLTLSAPAFAHSGGGGGGGGASHGASSGGAAGGGASGRASGTSTGSSDSGGALRNNVPTCAQGYVVKAGGCVRVSAGVLPDDQLYLQGRALAVAGYYRHALPILEAVTRTDDSMVFTMRGYAMRKLGRVDEGMALYAKALAIDPGNVNTHEYLGEAYVVQGKFDRARVELAKVESLCGATACEQYADLAKAIETGKPE